MPIAQVIVLLLVLCVAASPVWADQADAASAISSAKNMIVNGYTATKQAEAAGANITVLVNKLDEACSLLSQAESAYATNDFDEALDFATQSQITISNLVSEANALSGSGKLQRNIEFIFNVIFPIVGVYVVAVAGFLVWRFLKKKYETVGEHGDGPSRV
jgi:nitrate reductase NapE component